MSESINSAGSGGSSSSSSFSLLSDDIVLNIFLKLEEDPQDWARLACVSARFSSLVRNVCWKAKCSDAFPSVVADLLSPATGQPPGGWAALHKLAVCCPGLLHAGVLLENSDFGLEREIGPDESYRGGDTVCSLRDALPGTSTSPSPSSSSSDSAESVSMAVGIPADEPSDCGGWSLFDDLYFDTIYDVSESHLPPPPPENENPPPQQPPPPLTPADELSRKRKHDQCSTHADGPTGPHLAPSARWTLSRDQGSKLLAARFRGDGLYLTEWPGCVHAGGEGEEEQRQRRREHMLFRGVFRDFGRTRVWRTINDGGRRRGRRTDVGCAFCACRETWDLHSAFCLRGAFGYHDDGEPVVRAYVCENGHVAGAWTETPVYNS